MVIAKKKEGVKENFYVSSLNLLSNAELLTTDNEDNAIAAAAIIGFSKPNAAIGIAMEL